MSSPLDAIYPNWQELCFVHDNGHPTCTSDGSRVTIAAKVCDACREANGEKAIEDRLVAMYTSIARGFTSRAAPPIQFEAHIGVKPK